MVAIVKPMMSVDRARDIIEGHLPASPEDYLEACIAVIGHPSAIWASMSPGHAQTARDLVEYAMDKGEEAAVTLIKKALAETPKLLQ